MDSSGELESVHDKDHDMNGVTDTKHIATNGGPHNDIDELREHTHSGLSRKELVRIIAQAVHNLGYPESAQHLERAAGVEAMSVQMRRLRECVLQGRWDELEGILSGVTAFKTEEDAKAARFVLYEQKFLELLEAGQTADALACLRNNLTRCSPDPKLLHRLPMLHMCTSAEEVRQRAKWPGAGLESRSAVLQKLHRYIPPSDLLQENRLENLLCQAVDLQKRLAMFPYTRQENVSLLEDMEHEAERLPQKVLHRLNGHTDEVWCIQFSYDGRYLASASKDHTVIVWDWARLYAGEIDADSAVKHRLEGHSQDVCLLSWAPNSYFLLSGGSDKSVRLWDAVSGKCIHVFEKHTDQVIACTWMPDGRAFYSGAEKNIYKWDVDKRECVDSLDPEARVQDLSISNDGKRLVCCNTENRILVFDTEKKSVLRSMREEMYITSCCLAEDGESLLVNTTPNRQDKTKNLIDKEIHIWNITSGEMTNTFKGFKQCRYVIRGCFGGHKQMFVLCGSEDKQVYVWERHSGNLLFRLKGHTSTVNSITWCPRDPQLFASGSDDRTVIVWGVDPLFRRLGERNSSTVFPL